MKKQSLNENQIKKSEFICDKAYSRLDVFLADVSSLTRSRIKKLCDDGNVLIDGFPVKPKRAVRVGEKIEVFEELVELDLAPENMPLDIVYQDDFIAVINKPQGLTVHAGGGTYAHTLVNALLYHLDNLSGVNGVIRPGIVHRIDKDTSGLLVVAKNDLAHLSLAKQISEKSAGRVYVALLEGVVKDEQGTIETYISRSEKDRKKMAVSSSGRKAVTHFKVLERFKANTLCEFRLETGRTHQIRVHSKHIGHPIVGDKVYGYKKQRFELEGQLLHATKLQLKHPSTGKDMEFFAPLPQHFQKILDLLQKTEKI